MLLSAKHVAQVVLLKEGHLIAKKQNNRHLRDYISNQSRSIAERDFYLLKNLVLFLPFAPQDQVYNKRK